MTDPAAPDAQEERELLATLTGEAASWKGASIFSCTQITAEGLTLLSETAQKMRELVRSDGGDDRLLRKVLGTVFFEASTRTSCSFQAAMLRLGGKTLHVDGDGNSSAGKKGETVEDTIRCIECYTDVTVLRHPEEGSVLKVIEKASKPVINAGDGTGEHPTQALLDAFTIYDELKLQQWKLPKLIVVFLGDLKNSRTVHSLVKLLAHTGGFDQKLVLRYCSPKGLEIPKELEEFVSKYEGVEQHPYQDIKKAILNASVLYVTRVQRERFESESAYEAVKVRRFVLQFHVIVNLSLNLFLTNLLLI